MRERRNKQTNQPAVEIEITDVGFGGAGVARVDGRVWFVPYCLPGERVLARAIRTRKDFAEAELLRVLRPSPDRIDAPCEYFGRCGGCSYQHANYPAQLEIKHKQVRELLRRVAKIEQPEPDPIVASPEAFGYRNRITVHIADGKVGFHRRGSDGLVDVARCAIASTAVNEKLRVFRARRTFDGHRTIREFPATGFRQTNDAVARLMLEHVCRLLPERGSLLVDAYCGSGFFAKALRERFDEVVGVDWSEAAIQTAREDLGPGESYLQADVGESLPALMDGRPAGGTCVIADPPATGLPKEVTASILDAPTVADLVYVSCNPSTFARDVKRLAPRLQLVRVTPFDMFPQTADIEVVGHLQSLPIP